MFVVYCLHSITSNVRLCIFHIFSRFLLCENEQFLKFYSSNVSLLVVIYPLFLYGAAYDVVRTASACSYIQFIVLC